MLRIRGSVPLTKGPDPAIFVIYLQDANTNNFFLSFSAYYFLNAHLHNFSKIKSHKTGRNQGFSYYICLMIEGSGSGTGSRMPDNIRILIRNTARKVINFWLKCLFYIFCCCFIGLPSVCIVCVTLNALSFNGLGDYLPRLVLEVAKNVDSHEESSECAPTVRCIANRALRPTSTVSVISEVTQF